MVLCMVLKESFSWSLSGHHSSFPFDNLRDSNTRPIDEEADSANEALAVGAVNPNQFLVLAQLDNLFTAELAVAFDLYKQLSLSVEERKVVNQRA
jgi:CDP-diacylglycerol pyrophosphatase